MKKIDFNLVKLFLFLALGISPIGLSAQTKAVSDFSLFGQGSGVSLLFAGILAIEMVFVLALAYYLFKVVRMLKPQKAKPTPLMDRLNASVSLEKEQDIMLDHDYDGIHELDNNLPPWWKYGFYLSIVFAVIYLIHFHVTGTGKLQLAEYEQQMNDAAIELEEYQKRTANLVDENNVALITEPGVLEAAKAVFVKNCAPCHGAEAEGNAVGPNLTDNHWLHGGRLADVFKSIKYGWPEKGMKSWQKDLSAKQIQELASYIMSRKGSNPPNAKAPQGEIYQEE